MSDDKLSIHIKKILDKIGWPGDEFTHVALDDDNGSMNIAFFKEEPHLEDYSYHGYRRTIWTKTWIGKGKLIDEESVKYHNRFDSRCFTREQIEKVVVDYPKPKKKTDLSSKLRQCCAILFGD